MNSSAMDKLYEEAVVEMFRRVGLNYTFAEAKAYSEAHGRDWYQTRTWTKEEQEDFVKWLTRRIKYKLRSMTKEYCEKKARWFVFDIGWTLKEKSDANVCPTP